MADIDFKALQCLIVDDDHSFRLLLEAMLRRLEIGQITTARSGSDALAVFNNSRRPIDLIICDFSMGSFSGIELLKAIRMNEAKSASPDTCFIMATGLAAYGLVRIARALDVNGFIAKPFSVNTLKATIAKAYQRHVIADTKRYSEVAIPNEVQ